MSKDDFLGRWSQRKRAVEEEKSALEKAATEELVEEPAASDDLQIEMLDEDAGNLIESEDGIEGEAVQDAEGEEQEPHPAEGIDIEQLKYDSDFTVFMNEKVPETVRKMALRKLWKSNPILANIDGLNDYDEDFTDAATVFINSAGDVISGVRDQFWDDKQLAEKAKEDASDTQADDDQETENPEAENEADVEEVEASEVDDTNDVENDFDIEDADVEDMDDFDELEASSMEKASSRESATNGAQQVSKAPNNPVEEDEEERSRKK